MAIYIDDEVTEVDGASLADVLQSASDALAQVGRVVVEVQIDGDSLSGEQLHEKAESNVTQVELRLYTADPRSLAIGAMEQSREMLVEVRRLQDEAAALLQQDEVAKAMQEIAALISIWQQVLQALLQSAQLTGLKLDEQKHDARPLVEYTTDLANRLAALRDQIAAQDLLSVADSLQYEWPEVCDRWDAVFGDMIQWVRQLK